MEHSLLYQLQANLKREEEEIINRAFSSEIVNETKRIRKNIKLQLIRELNNNASELRKTRIKITKILQEQETNIKKQISKLKSTL